MISVVVATYNGEKYLLQMLQSIQAQTTKADEVIIADDASCDQTVVLAEEFIRVNALSDYWRVIRRNKNLGLQTNFLYAIAETKGDLVFLADQDDVWLEKKITVMSREMAEHRELWMLACRYDLIDGEGKAYNGKKRVSHIDYSSKSRLAYLSKSELIISSFIRGCSMCIRGEIRRYIDQNFDSGSLLGHDWYLSLLATIHGKAAFLNQKLMHYRIHDSNVSVKNKPFNIKDNRMLRVKELYEVVCIIKAVLESDSKSVEQSEAFAVFLKQRLQFFEKATIGRTLKLLGKIRYYRIYRHSRKGSWETYIADVIYAWKRKFTRDV